MRSHLRYCNSHAHYSESICIRFSPDTQDLAQKVPVEERPIQGPPDTALKRLFAGVWETTQVFLVQRHPSPLSCLMHDERDNDVSDMVSHSISYGS